MTSRIKEATEKGLITPPKWLPDNIHYEVITGSVAYGVSSDTSDMDIVGFCIPRKEVIFPHLAGHVIGFGESPESFGEFMQHHVVDKDKKQEYDFTIYNIVKFFQLCMENNPNMLDTLFVPQRCVLHCTSIAQIVRDNRKMFLHKGSYKKFRGYAYQQLKKINNGANRSNPKRQASIDKFGYDVKFAYHVVRLLLQGEQILLEHDLDIESNSEILKSIRRGEWSYEKIEEWFNNKEVYMEELYIKSDLRSNPDEAAIKRILVQCLEMHYGSLDKAVVMRSDGDELAKDIMKILSERGYI